jgi:hypothetical protein
MPEDEFYEEEHKDTEECYDDASAEDKLEDDEVSAEEAAFMEGYNSADPFEENQKKEKEKAKEKEEEPWDEEETTDGDSKDTL